MGLIDANKLYKHKFKSTSERMDLSVEYMFGWNDAIDAIVENAPTVDPYKHGHWITDMSGCWCSVCNEYSDYSTDYCPNCGAKMDEVTDG